VHPPFGISGDLHGRDGHATWGVDLLAFDDGDAAR
jgi:hypothetical protein